MTTHLFKKQPIKALSHQPQEIKDLEDAGIDIIDIVTSDDMGAADPDIISSAGYFKARKVPMFAARVGHGSKVVKLWVRRTVDEEGRLL